MSQQAPWTPPARKNRAGGSTARPFMPPYNLLLVADKMKTPIHILAIVLVFSVLSLIQPAYCCTIVMASRDGSVLVGNNEDRAHFETVVSFMPPEGSNHGAIMFGYDDAPFQGGMNDQGLFIDGNALPPTGWKTDSSKPEWRENSLRKLLGMAATEKDAEYFMKTVLLTCSTVKDVKEFVNKFNHPALARAKFPVADRTGSSIVVEFGQGRVQCIERTGWYQISTNFVTSNVTNGNYPCWRYRTADKLFREEKELSVPMIRDILRATHQEEATHGVSTVYSNIYDLKSGVINIYRSGDFDKVVILNLCEELKKGRRTIKLRSLFN